MRLIAGAVGFAISELLDARDDPQLGALLAEEYLCDGNGPQHWIFLQGLDQKPTSALLQKAGTYE